MIEVEEDMAPYSKLAIAVLQRSLNDIRLAEHHQDAVDFSRSPDAAFWCHVAGMRYETYLRKFNAEVTCLTV